MLGQYNIFLRRIHDTMRTFLESHLKLGYISCLSSKPLRECTDEWYDLCRLCNQSMGEFFVKRDEVSDINIAIVLLEKNIFSYLISAQR
jgi:hypothetical protein